MNTEIAAKASPEVGSKAHVPSGSGRLHRELSSFGALVLTLSCLSPVFSIYGVGSDVLQHIGTGAAGVFLFGIVTTLVWVAVYAELGSAYPYAGGDYVGVGAVLGGWAGFASLAVWAVTSAPIVALEAKTIAVYIGDLTSLSAPNAITFGALIAATAVALLAVRTSTFVTGLFLCVEMLAVVLLIGMGMLHPAHSVASVLVHPVMLDSAGMLVAPSVGAVALGAVSAAWATAGGNQAVVFGEELKEPHRNMGRIIVIAGMVGAFATALPVIAVALGAGDLRAVFGAPAPFSAFVSLFAGPLAGRALSASVALAIFNALIVQIMFCARLFFSIGRDAIFHRYISQLLARVHGPSGSPRAATIIVGTLSGVCCLLGTHLLVIFVTGIVTYTLGLVCLAVFVGRRKGLVGQAGYWRAPLFPLAPLSGLALAIIFCIADLFDADAGRPSMLILGGVVVLSVVWYHVSLKRRPGGWSPRLE